MSQCHDLYDDVISYETEATRRASTGRQAAEARRQARRRRRMAHQANTGPEQLERDLARPGD
jgi:hypothetical protein